MTLFKITYYKRGLLNLMVTKRTLLCNTLSSYLIFIFVLSKPVCYFRILLSVYCQTQHINIVKTHYTGNMFRLNNSHHQAYINVQTIIDHCVLFVWDTYCC
jgi:hypothetical protein